MDVPGTTTDQSSATTSNLHPDDTRKGDDNTALRSVAMMLRGCVATKVYWVRSCEKECREEEWDLWMEGW